MLTISFMLDSMAVSRTAGQKCARAASESMTLSEQEFEDFYGRYSGPLFGYIHRMTGDPSLAEDLAQKAFVRLLGATLKTKDEGALKSYLYRIGTNLVYDHWRRGPSESSIEELGTVQEDRAAAPELRADMQKLFEKLEPKERALLWLAHVEGAPHRDIAEILGMKEKSIRVILFRARKKFASILESNGYGAER